MTLNMNNGEPLPSRALAAAIAKVIDREHAFINGFDVFFNMAYWTAPALTAYESGNMTLDEEYDNCDQTSDFEKKHPCGTCACVAGTAVMFNHPELLRYNIEKRGLHSFHELTLPNDEASQKSYARLGREALKLPLGHDLFEGENSPEDVSKALSDYAKTGDWKSVLRKWGFEGHALFDDYQPAAEGE